MRGCYSDLLFILVLICILTFLLLRIWFFNVIPARKIVAIRLHLLLCFWLIVSYLPRNDGHEVLDAIREHILDVLGLCWMILT